MLRWADFQELQGRFQRLADKGGFLKDVMRGLVGKACSGARVEQGFGAMDFLGSSLFPVGRGLDG